MIDLDKEFQALDAISDPDLSSAIERRVASGSGVADPTTHRGLLRSRLIAAAVVFAVFGAAAVFAWRAFAPIRSHAPASPSPSVNDPWGEYPEGMERASITA